MLKNNKILSTVAVGAIVFGLCNITPAIADEDLGINTFIYQEDSNNERKHHDYEGGSHEDRKAIMREKFQQMSPEEREEFKAKRKNKMKEKWANMSDDERQNFRKKHKGKIAERMKNMSPEERGEFKAKHKGKVKKRLHNSSPEQRGKFKQKMQKHHGKGKDMRREHKKRNIQRHK